MKAYIVTDLGFGDCGKGTIVDFLTRHLEATLVVRFNGGAQAAHTVITPEGLSHTFHSFGSGTLAGPVETFLSRFVQVNPLAIWHEAESLKKIGVKNPLGRLVIDQDALITSPYSIFANRLREFDRGEGRHGSCGHGIGETAADYIRYPNLVLTVKDLQDPRLFRVKLAWHRGLKKAQMAEIVKRLSGKPNLPSAITEALELLRSDEEFESALEVYAGVLSLCRIVDGREFLHEALTQANVVFEGAQGVLLDEDWGFHPNTTWSTTTSQNALELLDEAQSETQVTRIGVVRSYQTRHGAGPFPTECSELTDSLVDIHNPTNDWQGAFRFGWFDAVLTRYALLANGGIDQLAVTCLDDLANCGKILIADSYRGYTNLPIWIKGDRIHQEKLTTILSMAEPIWSSRVCVADHLKDLADTLNVPIGITSFGPRSDQKTIKF